MSDYQKIEKAIHFIRSSVDHQPTLDEVATHVHLSPYHFQRLFSRWAGITPKRFLQVLTLEQAKALLKERQNTVLDVAHSIGLSSSSRLYEHFVSIEAVTPSEYKHRGHGLNICYGYHDTPYGEAFIAVTDRGICKLGFIASEARSTALNDLRNEWPNAALVTDTKQTGQIIERLFKPNTKSGPISLWVRGTNFQINVWRALLAIQPGELTSYSDIANNIGKPAAVRAVGTAIGANPVAFVIPCHRVIRQSGELGGYRWGLDRKHAMLAKELAGRC